MLGNVYGSSLMPNRTWKDNVSISGANVGCYPADEYMCDPSLPGYMTNTLEAGGPAVIPAGRFVAIGFSTSSTGRVGTLGFDAGLGMGTRTPLTLHDGNRTNPVGMTEKELTREDGNLMNLSPLNSGYKKWFQARVPMVFSVNNAHGVIYSGDRLSSHFGSTTSPTLFSTLHRGKPVRWFERRLFHNTAAASSTILLPDALYPGITPIVVTAATASGATYNPASNATLSWNTSANRWQATFSAPTVTEIFYLYGQGSDQIAGEALRLRSITEITDRHSMDKFVEMSSMDWMNFPPPMSTRQPVTQVGTGPDPVTGSGWETLSMGGTNTARVANTAIANWRPFLIAIVGTVIDDNGVSTTYTAGAPFILPVGPSLGQAQYFQGRYHSVNWATGVVEISSNITITTCQVSYSYITDSRNAAVLWGQGILGMTDGGLLSGGTTISGQGYGSLAHTAVPTNAAGTPAFLNNNNVVGELRLMVY